MQWGRQGCDLSGRLVRSDDEVQPSKTPLEKSIQGMAADWWYTGYAGGKQHVCRRTCTMIKHSVSSHTQAAAAHAWFIAGSSPANQAARPLHPVAA